MSTERQYKDADTEKPKYADRRLSQCHFDHNNPHVDLPGIEPGDQQ
jgi:hypothetical protein